MPKIMHVLCTNSFSGAENVAISIINNFKSEAEFVYVSPDGPIKDVLKENGIAFYPIKGVNVFTLKKAIKEIKPDIIHAHDFIAGFTCAFAAGKIPVINHLHNNAPWIKSFNPLTVAYFAAAKRIKKILTVSDAVMNEYIFGKAFKSKTAVIGNQVDIASIKAKAAASTAAELYDIIFLGRLSTPKNPVGFLEIISLVKSDFPKIHAVMVGDGELRQQVEDKIKELNLQDNITLKGFCKNPYGYLKGSKIICMPSLWDGCPLASVEALALGKPILASPVGGLVNVVTDECGRLCKTNSEFAEQIKLLLTNGEIYGKKSAAALLRADKFDNISEYTQAIKSAYNEVLLK